MQNLLQTLRNLGAARLAGLAGVGVMLIAFFAYLAVRLTTPAMGLLYADLDMTEAGQIATRLQSMSVPYQVRGDGNQILVPAEQVQQLRMQLAGEGLPSGGSVGYEIFDRAPSLGTSNFVQSMNHVRALEGELARTIRSIGSVKSARVHLVLPQRDLFSRTRQDASASIILKMKGAGRLDRPQVQSIQHLVASAVAGLSPARISIVDDRGTLLARGTAADGSATIANAEEIRVAFESRMARAIEELLERSVGPGKVRAEVAAEFDYDRLTVNTETFDPDGQVPRSTQSTEEQIQTRDINQENVGVAGNLPENQGQGLAGGPANQTNRTDTTTNYEISRTIKNLVREGGSVKRLSAAVLVDGVYDAQGTYQPRPPEQMEQIAKLVRSAIGFNTERGDAVEIVNQRFAEVAPKAIDEAPEGFLGLARAEIMRLVEIAVLAVLAILGMLLVVRPLIGRLFEPGSVAPSGGTPLLTDQSGGVRQLTGPAGAAGALAGPAGGASAAPEAMIDISSIEGRVKASSIKKVGEIVEKHPEEAVSIVRNWLYQDADRQQADKRPGAA